MRSALNNHNLSSVPHIYQYRSHVDIYTRKPRFAPVVAVRNEHGDSALDWGEEAAVSVSIATHGEDQLHIAWCPATYGEIDDPTFANAFPGSPTHTNPRAVRHRKINVPENQTVEGLQQYALDWNWHWDEPVNGLWPVDYRTRVDIHRKENEALTYACVSGGKVYVTSVDDYFNDFDMPGYSGEDIIEGPFGEGSAPAVIGRSEVWIAYPAGDSLRVRRWHREFGTQEWTIAKRADWRPFNLDDMDERRASRKHVGWSGWQWWDNTGFRVREMADGARLLSYQSGPGMAAMRIWRDGVLSDPYPVMFSDKEYAFQHCRVTDITGQIVGEGGYGRYYAVIERGVEGSDGKVSSWFTSLAYSEDGVIWSDWSPVGTGRFRGALCVRRGWICLISPGRLWFAPGTTLLGTPETRPLGRVESWRINQRAGSVATVGDTVGVSYAGDVRPQPGDELRRYLTVNGLHEYCISTEEVDVVQPRSAHNEASIAIQSRGPLKAGIVYRPPVDEIFASGDVRFVEFAEQTVVEKVGQFMREDGLPSVENGKVLRVEKGAWRIEQQPDPTLPQILVDVEVPTGEPALAILPQPVRPGAFWTNARLLSWQNNAGILFAYHDPLIDSDPDNDDAETALDYWGVRYLDGNLQLIRVKEGATTVVRDEPIDTAIYMPDLAVRVQNYVITVYVSAPTSALSAYGEDLAASHAKNLEPDNVIWVPLWTAASDDLPTEATYVGVFGMPGAKFRHLQMVEIDHIQTLGRLVDAIGRRSGILLDRPEDWRFSQNFFPANLSVQGTNVYTVEGLWLRQRDPWIFEQRFLGFDVELEIEFLNAGEELSLVFNSQQKEAFPWGVGGIEVAINRYQVSVRRRGLKEEEVEGTPGWIGLYETVQETARLNLTDGSAQKRVRVVLYAVDERRSVLAIYLNGAWAWALTLDYAALGGYFGMRGTGRYKNLWLSRLPQFIGDHVWTYRRSAVDEIKELLRYYNYHLLEEANGRVRLCSQNSARATVGDMPATMELLGHTTTEPEGSVIKVAGAEVWASFVDPRLLGLVGFRTLEVDMPYLWTEKQCMDHAKLLADLFYAESQRRSAVGAADPRLEVGDVYRTLDTDGVTRGYLVEAVSLTVNQVREPHADMRVELRRLD